MDSHQKKTLCFPNGEHKLYHLPPLIPVLLLQMVMLTKLKNGYSK